MLIHVKNNLVVYTKDIICISQRPSDLGIKYSLSTGGGATLTVELGPCVKYPAVDGVPAETKIMFALKGKFFEIIFTK